MNSQKLMLIKILKSEVSWLKKQAKCPQRDNIIKRTNEEIELTRAKLK